MQKAGEIDELLGAVIKSMHSPQFDQVFSAWLQACVPFDNITRWPISKANRPSG